LGVLILQSLTRLAAPSSGSAGASTSVGGENIIAYDIDRLFQALACSRLNSRVFSPSIAATVQRIPTPTKEIAHFKRSFLFRRTLSGMWSPYLQWWAARGRQAR